MRFDIITIFPHIFESYFGTSIVKRAQEKKRVVIRAHNLRDYTEDKHRTVDDTPYGGGAGMVVMAEPILRAYAAAIRGVRKKGERRKIVVLSAKGKQFTQAMAYQWASRYGQIVLVSGRYEGIDERVQKILNAEEVSIGPYVTTDGDVAAMVLVSAVARLIPGVIRLESLAEESHWKRITATEAEEGRLEYPHYTRPEALTWRGKTYRVPRVLLSGNHRKIASWRAKKMGRTGGPR